MHKYSCELDLHNALLCQVPVNEIVDIENNITFSFGSVNISLNSRDTTMRISNTTLELKIVPIIEENVWEIGDIFMMKTYLYLDYENNRIGIQLYMFD